MTHSATPDTTDQQELPRAIIWLALILLIATGALLRVHGMGGWYYNPDESLHLGMAQGKDLSEVLQFSHYEAHPPLGNILQHYWIMLSQAPWFTRSLPLLFGLLTIPLYFFIGRLAADELTGLCCAGLITFSQGCIIQSYIMRHYMPFVFFVSLSFYCFLHWREERTTRTLISYSLFALLACLTHFSGIFDIFCFAIYESLALLKRKDTKPLRSWTALNAIIGLMAIYVYYRWQPILLPLKSYFAGHTAGNFVNLAAHTLFYPLVTPGYVLPGYKAALILLLAEVGLIVFSPRFITNLPGLRSLLTLSGLAYALGMLLVLTRIYPEPGTRHSIWILPFVILPAGWLLADALRWLAHKFPPYETSLPVAGALLALLGIVAYSPADRFDDSSEYVWKPSEWQSFSDYMQTFGPRDLIITEKDDGIMLANLYRSMGQDAFTGRAMAAIAPYRDTHILFNPYYPRNYSTEIFLSTLKEAQEKHMFDSIDRLVFLRMTWSRSPLTDLMLCPSLEKGVVLFPPGRPSRDRIMDARAAILIVSKETLLEDILLPEGKAHACLNGLHDMVKNAGINGPAR